MFDIIIRQAKRSDAYEIRNLVYEGLVELADRFHYNCVLFSLNIQVIIKLLLIFLYQKNISMPVTLIDPFHTDAKSSVTKWF